MNSVLSHADVARAPRRDVAVLARFALRHGGFATAVLEPVGRAGTRIVLVGEDGHWGDHVVPSMTIARSVCAAAKVDIAPGWSPALVAGMGYTRSHAH